jgi:hypothetical protein
MGSFDLNDVALIVGYCGLFVGGLVVVIYGLLLAVAFWPFRWQWSRDLPSNLDTPTGSYPINAIIGISSRGKLRWCLGFMLFQPTPGEPRRARVVVRKSPLPQPPAST